MLNVTGAVTTTNALKLLSVHPHTKVQSKSHIAHLAEQFRLQFRQHQLKPASSQYDRITSTWKAMVSDSRS